MVCGAVGPPHRAPAAEGDVAGNVSPASGSATCVAASSRGPCGSPASPLQLPWTFTLVAYRSAVPLMSKAPLPPPGPQSSSDVGVPQSELTWTKPPAPVYPGLGYT